jgi:uncharacterized membrane protein
MSEKYEIRLSDALKEAWGIFMKGPEVFVGITFLYFAVIFVIGKIPLLGALVSFLAYSLLFPAYIAAADASTGKEKVTFESLQGLVPLVPQILALSVVKGILLTAGFFLLFFPGLFLMVAFLFAELILVLERKQFVDALKESYRLASQNLLGVLGLLVFVFFLTFSGILLVGIGVLVTLPLSALVIYSVYRRICVRVVVE